MKHVAILCGGSTYEHEVSIITGIQVAENIDKRQYSFSLVYFDKDNQPFLIKDFKSKRDFKNGKRVLVDFVKREGKVCIMQPKHFNKLIPIDVCYMAFHGGTGESGPIQGQLELLNVPFTSPGQEGSVISMNKSLTKEVLRANNLPTLPSYTLRSVDYETNKVEFLTNIKTEFEFPVIIKPVHLGSSIAIEIAKNEVELEKYLNVAVRIDKEISIEPALTNFTEYNLSVRTNKGRIEYSPIEEPKRAEEILSFDDKYANGSKKAGGRGGMELLDRTVPAEISTELAKEIRTLATKIYQVIRLAGLVRIDFMYSDNKLYCTEVNPIPGSMSFYLWEAGGEQFKDQISISIEDALFRATQKIDIVPYETDIVEKFIGS